jgi:hypothetical protein
MPTYIAVPDPSSNIKGLCAWKDGGPTPSRYAEVIAIYPDDTGTSLSVAEYLGRCGVIRIHRSLLTSQEYTEETSSWSPVPVKKSIIGIKLTGDKR